MSYVVAIDGNIASGKTTVLKEIERLGYKVYFEPFENNPWLPLYYREPKKYALNTQLWFLSERFRQYKNADFSTDEIVFIERSMYTDRHVFVKMIAEQGNLDEIELKTYIHHFDIYKNPKPDLAVTFMIEPEECLKRLHKRNRGMEAGVSVDYLRDLGKVYREAYHKLGYESVAIEEPDTPENLAKHIITIAEQHKTMADL